MAPPEPGGTTIVVPYRIGNGHSVNSESPVHQRLAANLAAVRERIALACAACDRSPEDVRLIAVTKYAQEEWVNALIDLGVIDLGESRPQQLVDRAGRMDSQVRWHLIGQLQRNKVRPVLPLCELIHSVDSMRLVHRINDIAADLGLVSNALIEVNISGEASKSGFDPDELLANWIHIREMKHIAVAGLMTMAPLTDAPGDTVPVFRTLCELRNELVEKSSGEDKLPVLSMGMSRDFEIAIGEGATHIRVGSRLFEGLDQITASEKS